MGTKIASDELIHPLEAGLLLEFIENTKAKHPKATIHNIIMKWLDSPQASSVMDNFRKSGIIKPYGAYLLEYQLGMIRRFIKIQT